MVIPEWVSVGLAKKFLSLLFGGQRNGRKVGAWVLGDRGLECGGYL